MAKVAAQGKRITRIVFIALLLDILSFTIILPLLPRSLEAYKQREGSDTTTLLYKILQQVALIRQQIITHAGPQASKFLHQGSKADLVLLGGLLGSLYSLLQCLIAPIIGRLADKWGRKSTMMVCMVGNVVWTVMWIFSWGFESFLVARIIAGLSEGNVQISTIVIADVTNIKERSHGMALVGIAFAFGFTLGPSIGAYFASLPLESHASGSAFGYAPFATAAVFSLVLLLVETAYLYVKLPETLNFTKQPSEEAKGEAKKDSKDISSKNTDGVLKKLNWIHFIYLFFFSGMEYTLTFLTHDKFNFTNSQQVNCLNSMVSLISGQSVGKKLGDFRSAGQIGRALGPMFACSIYWVFGPSTCYFIGFIATAVITAVFARAIPASTQMNAKSKTD
ncbi:hypothetical protein GGI12_001795 [Dipsacomyces acuminosporus]|nr:hypothetical protein GGI12_001795 [Dipsacomyces acuminosporus]